MSEPTMETLVQRLDRVERENRRLKRAGAVALAVLAAVVLMGQAEPSKVVEAEKFVLRDPSGKVRAELNVWPDGSPFLRLYDDDKKLRVSLGVLPDGAPSLELIGKVGKSRAVLTVHPTGSPLLALYGKAGKIMWSKP